MLRCVLHDVEGHDVIMPRLAALVMKIDEGVPADSLYAVFPYTETRELCGITVYDDSKTVFVGVVDEEAHERDARGGYLTVSARSLAAHLLDNEAMPCAYDHPSFSLIYGRYVKPYGILSGDSDDAVYFGEQSVTKGSSCWKVLKTFCTACYSSVPRVSSTGVLYPKGILRKEKLVFGTGGIPYTSVNEIRKRCEEISAVYVKTSNVDAYTLPVINDEAYRRGVRRVRYLNAVLTESPMSCADAMIENGTKKAYAVRLRCPSCLIGAEGKTAALHDEELGDREDLYVGAVYYRMTKDGEYSDVTLKRRSTDVDQ